VIVPTVNAQGVLSKIVNAGGIGIWLSDLDEFDDVALNLVLSHLVRLGKIQVNKFPGGKVVTAGRSIGQQRKTNSILPQLACLNLISVERVVDNVPNLMWPTYDVYSAGSKVGQSLLVYGIYTSGVGDVLVGHPPYCHSSCSVSLVIEVGGIHSELGTKFTLPSGYNLVFYQKLVSRKTVHLIASRYEVDLPADKRLNLKWLVGAI
jgi:hypothetical protein